MNKTTKQYFLSHAEHDQRLSSLSLAFTYGRYARAVADRIDLMTSFEEQFDVTRNISVVSVAALESSAVY